MYIYTGNPWNNDGNTSTSTTKDGFNPALSAGYGCSNGMDRATNCRDWQEPINVKPQQSPKNEKLHSTWMNPYKPCGPEGQSAWHPQGFVAGNGCSDKGGRATDRRDGPVQAEAKLKPSMTNERSSSRRCRARTCRAAERAKAKSARMSLIRAVFALT